MKPSEHQRDIQHEDVLGKDYARGHYIFREGDMCDALYIIQRGKVRIFTVLPFGQEVELALVGPGEVFGITSLFDDLPRSASAITVDDASILKLEREKLLKAIHHDPTLVFFILKSMSIRARRLKERLAEAVGGKPGEETGNRLPGSGRGILL